MALSDSCFEFLVSVGEAARNLAEEAHWYSSPTGPFNYGEEIDALRRAAMKIAEEPTDVEAGAHLLRLALSVMRYHDTPPPDAANQSRRKEEMTALVRILQANVDQKDEQAMPALVESLTKEGSKEGAEQVKSILKRLSKPAYEMAVKIISDIGSATMKKLLGL
jgi:hypothetical protein